MFERFWPRQRPAAAPSADATGAAPSPPPAASDPSEEAFRHPYPAFDTPHPHAWLEPFYRRMARWLILLIYRAKYQGFDQLPEDGPGIIIANHVSYLDGLFINAGSRRPIRYVIDKVIYEWPGVNYFMQLNRAIPIYPKKEIVEAALNEISAALQRGELVCIFPEGRLTYTGFLGRFKPGIEHILKRDPVPVYPVGIYGLWGSMFSRKYLYSKERRWFRQLPDVRLVMGPPIQPEQAGVDLFQREVMRLMNEAKSLK